MVWQFFEKKKIYFLRKEYSSIIKKDFENYEIAIILGCLSNDPSSDLDTKLSYELNVVANYKIAEICATSKIKKVIYASSGSVYGLKKKQLKLMKLNL